MTLRRLIFLLGFVFIPVVFWISGVSPALERRGIAVARQENAGQVLATFESAITDRDTLKKTWEEFKPLADEALMDMEQELNPILIPRRVAYLAGSVYGLQDLRIQPGGNTEEFLAEFSLSVQGTYENLVAFVDALERGRQRVRFEDLKITFPSGAVPGAQEYVILSATLIIPRVPGAGEQ